MTPDVSFWWAAAAYDYLDDLTVGGLAWEYLRRNSNYQIDFAAIQRKDVGVVELIGDLRERWGLRFSSSTKPK